MASGKCLVIINKRLVIGVIFAALLLTSCGVNVDVASNAAGETVVICRASLGTAFMAVIHSINGTADNTPLISMDDCAQMAAELSKDGLEHTALRTPTNDSVEVIGRTSLAGETRTRGKDKTAGKMEKSGGNLLLDTGCLTMTAAGGKQRLSLVLNDATLKALYGALSEDVQAYLDLSMAGVFSGEAMTREDWLDALAIVYGKPFADEAAGATVVINMSIATDGGKTAKKTYTVPLADILTGQNIVCNVEG